MNPRTPYMRSYRARRYFRENGIYPLLPAKCAYCRGTIPNPRPNKRYCKVSCRVMGNRKHE